MSIASVDAASRVQNFAATARGLAELAKPRLSSLVLFTSGIGYWLGSPGALDWIGMLATLVGAALAATGANTLNQWVECPLDMKMKRTAARPLPSGRVTPGQALAFGWLTIFAGWLLLDQVVNGLAANLALLVAVLYVALYTPLKRRSSLCTIVGAVCGALPPLIGWAGAAGSLSAAAWVLFGILFLWQIPHFLAIDWYHREDYARGGFAMVSKVDPSGAMSGRQAVIYCLALLPISLAATPLGLAGPLYAAGALLLGLGFTWLAVVMYRERTDQAARRLFLGSLAYLPLLLLLLVVDPTR